MQGKGRMSDGRRSFPASMSDVVTEHSDYMAFPMSMANDGCIDMVVQELVNS